MTLEELERQGYENRSRLPDTRVRQCAMIHTLAVILVLVGAASAMMVIAGWDARARRFCADGDSDYGQVKAVSVCTDLVLLKLQSAAGSMSGLVCGMADHPINDYYLVTSRRGEHPDRWSWEIRRKSKPLGIKMTGDGFQSETAAQFAGKNALVEFLADLTKEEKRPRK